jgi:pentapeptide repeat protein
MAGWVKEQLEQISKNGKKFRGLKLQQAVFDDMNLERADFRGCSLAWASFKRCNLKEANFEGTNCSFADFDGANVHRANFKDANMCDVKFDVVDAFGITLTMDCKSFYRMKPNAGFYLGLLFYGFLMDPVQSDTFNPEDFKEKLSVLFGPERYTTLRNLYATRQM